MLISIKNVNNFQKRKNKNKNLKNKKSNIIKNIKKK